MNASGCVPTLYLYCPSHGLTPHAKTKHRHDTRFGLFVGSKSGFSDGVLVLGSADVGDFDVGKEVDCDDVLGKAVVGEELVGSIVSQIILHDVAHDKLISKALESVLYCENEPSLYDALEFFVTSMLLSPTFAI